MLPSRVRTRHGPEPRVNHALGLEPGRIVFTRSSNPD
jgi:hypothetical protein